MVRDIWRGVGNWRVDVAHWSTGAAPDASSNVVVALGDDTLASSATVASVAVGNQASLDVAVGGALTDSGGFYNYGASLVGGAATIGGSLYNSGQFAITAAATVSAASLKNLGSIAITGAAHGLARLDIAHAAPAALSGSFALVDDALLEFDSGGITSISATGGLTLQGAGARVSIGAGTANSALSDLSSNNGTFGLDDDVAVTTTTGLTNLHDLYVDTGANVGAGVEYLGGSRLAIGGVLTNASTGNIWIGDDDLVGSTSVTTRGLDNQGSIVLAGDEKLGTASRVALDVRGAASSTLTGSLAISGDATLAFDRGAITSIASGGYLGLTGSQARISIGGGTTQAALGGLSNNAGEFDLEGSPTLGLTRLALNHGLHNEGKLDLDIGRYHLSPFDDDEVLAGAGGSRLTIDGALTNSGTVRIGDLALAATTVAYATSLFNSGTIDIVGDDDLHAKSLAALEIASAAPGTLEGRFFLDGDALLAFGGGVINAIGANSSLELDGGQARVSVGGKSNSGSLARLSSNAGLFDIEGVLGSAEALATTTDLVNSGVLLLDTYIDQEDVDDFVGDGGSRLAIGGTLTNTGTVQIGNADLFSATTLRAGGLVNIGNLTIDGGGNYNAFASLFVTGAATNAAVLAIGDDSTLATTGGYTQIAGTTTVTGKLKGRIDIQGGELNFTTALTQGDGTGPIAVGHGGDVTFDNAVAVGHFVTFTDGAGALHIDAPSAFAATLAGFQMGDTIDLVGLSQTSFTFAHNQLDLFDNGALVAGLTFAGVYAAGDFSIVSDGNGGVDVLHALPATGVLSPSRT